MTASSTSQSRKVDEERIRAGSAELVPFNVDQARLETFHVLSEPNRISRLRALAEMLEKVTPENWRWVREAFTEQSKHTGRTHDFEWALMLERVGEVAGAEALGPNGLRGTSEMPHLLAGHASRNADAAIEWFAQRPQDEQERLIAPLLSGIAQTDPRRALSFAALQGPEIWGRTIGPIVHAAIQRGGITEAETLLDVVPRSPDGERSPSEQVFLELTMRKLHMDGIRNQPTELLAWVDEYLRPGSPVGAASLRNIVARTSRTDAIGTLLWLEARAERLSPSQAAIAYGSVAQALQSQAPEQLSSWMTSNPSHPQRDIVVEVMADSATSSGDVEAATSWASQIHDPAIRARAQARIRERTAQRSNR